MKIKGEALFLVLRPELDSRAGGREGLRGRAQHHVGVQVDHKFPGGSLCYNVTLKGIILSCQTQMKACRQAWML